MTVSCYIYYRVCPDHVSEASTAAQATLERIRHLTGVSGQLLSKVNEPLLWMEVYDGIVDQAIFLTAMRECLEETDLGRWLDGDRQRHTEIFQTASFSERPSRCA